MNRHFFRTYEAAAKFIAALRVGVTYTKAKKELEYYGEMTVGKHLVVVNGPY